MTMQKGTVSVLVFLLMTTLCAPTVVAQTGALNGEWRSYGGDDGSTKYAALDQIDADNVDRLQVAWQWESSDTAVIANRELRAGAFKATPLMVGGVLYIRTSLSIVAAIDAETGELAWKGGRYGHGQLLLADGHLVVLTERGDVVLVRATPDGHDELARFAAIRGKTWNTPTIADGRLFVRNTTEMAAFNIEP